MKNIKEILPSVNDAFSNIQNSYADKLRKVKSTTTYQDLIKLNGTENVNKRLNQLYIDPIADPIGVEKIIGNKNHLMDISYFRKGLKISRTVCRIIEFSGENKEAIGTGFLIGPNLLMTNNHVIGDIDEAIQYMAEFEYERKEDGTIEETALFEFDPQTFFLTSSPLDYTIVSLRSISRNNPDKKLEDYGWNKLSTSQNKILNGERVSIIQHPEGQPKMLAIRENKVVDIQAPFIHYTTDTQPGSSGSLVANDQWEIIALHRSSVPEEDEYGRIVLKKGKGFYQSESDYPFINWIANQGVMMDDILKDVSSKDISRFDSSYSEYLLEGFQEDKEEEYSLPEA